MKHVAERSPRVGRWGLRVSLTALLVLGSYTPFLAAERSAQPDTRAQAANTRQPAPQASPSAPAPTTGTPAASTGTQTAPTARDTRQIPPKQYRRSAKSGRSVPHRGGHRSHVGIHFGYYYPRYYDPYYWRWGWWGPYWYGGPYWGYPAPHYPTRYVTADLGALDLNVKPKKVAVYVDGQYVGQAKHFDGYPGYLWLEKGSHEVTFFLEGYETLTRRFEVRPGQVFDVRMRMVVGEAVWPEGLGVDREARARSTAPPSPQRQAAPEPTPTAPEWEESAATGQDSGRLQFVIEPADASVYLDGRFLGSGSELEALHAGLIVEPGRHTIQVVRPGFSPQELDVFVEPGGELDLKVRLDASSG